MTWGMTMTMTTSRLKSITIWLAIAAVVLAMAPSAYAKKKKQEEPAAARKSVRVDHSQLDTSSLVWPLPPDVPRIKFLREIYGEDKPPVPAGQAKKKKKQGWMDRVAGSLALDVVGDRNHPDPDVACGQHRYVSEAERGSVEPAPSGMGAFDRPSVGTGCIFLRLSSL